MSIETTFGYCNRVRCRALFKRPIMRKRPLMSLLKKPALVSHGSPANQRPNHVSNHSHLRNPHGPCHFLPAPRRTDLGTRDFRSKTHGLFGNTPVQFLGWARETGRPRKAKTRSQGLPYPRHSMRLALMSIDPFSAPIRCGRPMPFPIPAGFNSTASSGG